jgi:serine/threonine-protein kinase
MEWLDGIDLRALLSRTRVDRATATGIAGAVARGLAYAHEVRDAGGAPLEIVHRDVSPHNILLTREGAVKILDFGIAKARTRLVRTRTGVTRGKVGYMSPEQLAGLGVDARSDIFSLGVVLWEMLTGRVLWDRESDTATGRAIRDESATLPSLDDPDLPPHVDALVVGMLSKFPLSRPARARDLADRLDEMARSLGVVDLGDRVAALVAPHVGPAIAP